MVMWLQGRNTAQQREAARSQRTGKEPESKGLETPRSNPHDRPWHTQKCALLISQASLKPIKLTIKMNLHEHFTPCFSKIEKQIILVTVLTARDHSKPCDCSVALRFHLFIQVTLHSLHSRVSHSLYSVQGELCKE